MEIIGVMLLKCLKLLPYYSTQIEFKRFFELFKYGTQIIDTILNL